MCEGWIKLHRSLSSNDIWTLEPFTKGQAWIDLLMLTNHKKGIIKLRNGEIVQINRGECGYSKLSLADRWKWSRNKVTRFFDFLIKEKMIQQKDVSKTTILVIVNYDEYQNETSNETSNETMNDTSNETLTRMNKNEKKKENVYKRKVFTIPSLSEVKTYCSERNNTINAQYFIDFYSSKGWCIGKEKMKDWKAAVRTWEQKEKKERKNEPRPRYREI